MIVGCRGPVLVLLAAVLAGVGSASADAQGARQRSTTPSQRAASLDARLELMLRSMRIARDWHIEAPSKSALIAGAIEGLLASVDPESEFYTRDDLRRVARFVPGGGATIGLEVRRDPPERRRARKGYHVVAARDGSPAARSGLKAGDLITQVDGMSVGEVPYLVMTQVMLEGRPGSDVRLTVERAGTDQGPDEILVQRIIERGDGITVDEVAPGISRIRISSLAAASAAALVRSWEAHQVDGDRLREIRGLVLDLRSTAADSTDGARAVADAFLGAGPILRMVSRHTVAGFQANASPGDLARGRPIALLVDGGTSGVAEMLASALQEARRARIVGTQTAGRGGLRTLVALDRSGRKGLLRLTTQRLVTPSGGAIEGKGVTPEVLIEQLPASARCRTLDIEHETIPGLCVPRTVAQDTQLQRAISTLDEPLVAAQASESASVKP